MPRRLLPGVTVTVVVLIGVVMAAVGLRAARLRAFEVRCQGNLRQMTYAAMAYCGNWNEQLPTRLQGTEGALNEVCRLPCIGFDTVTIWDWGTFVAAEDGPSLLGGWAFMMRDYLKNDYDLAICPGGWYGLDDLMHKWDGARPGGLYSDKMGYLWLIHRATPTASANGRRSTDKEADILHVGSDFPGLLAMTDYIMWVGHDNGFRISGNHQRSRAPNAHTGQICEFLPSPYDCYRL